MKAARAGNLASFKCINAAHACQRVLTAAGDVTPDQPGR